MNENYKPKCFVFPSIEIFEGIQLTMRSVTGETSLKLGVKT